MAKTSLIDVNKLQKFWDGFKDKLHIHSNQTILDNTTASYTIEDKTTLGNVSTTYLPLSGGTLTGNTYFANGTKYYIDMNGNASFNTLESSDSNLTGDTYFGTDGNYSIDCNGDTYLESLTINSETLFRGKVKFANGTNYYIDNLGNARLNTIESNNFKGDLEGNALTADSASSLAAFAGNSTHPVYFSEDGIPVPTTYELHKTVPTDAVFTDTVYTLPKASAELGGVRTTSTITDISEYTPTPIVDGIPYYKEDSGSGVVLNIQDNLTSTSTTDALSANQGHVIKEYLDEKATYKDITQDAFNILVSAGNLSDDIYYNIIDNIGVEVDTSDLQTQINSVKSDLVSMDNRITEALKKHESSIIVYVSDSGSDTTGDGTKKNPWGTIQKAVEECPNKFNLDVNIQYIIDCTLGVNNYVDINIYDKVLSFVGDFRQIGNITISNSIVDFNYFNTSVFVPDTLNYYTFTVSNNSVINNWNISLDSRDIHMLISQSNVDISYTGDLSTTSYYIVDSYASFVNIRNLVSSHSNDISNYPKINCVGGVVFLSTDGTFDNKTYVASNGGQVFTENICDYVKNTNTLVAALPTITTSTVAPTDDDGKDGDIWIVYEK